MVLFHFLNYQNKGRDRRTSPNKNGRERQCPHLAVSLLALYIMTRNYIEMRSGMLKLHGLSSHYAAIAIDTMAHYDNIMEISNENNKGSIFMGADILN
jgi:hypothetical protein